VAAGHVDVLNGGIYTGDGGAEAGREGEREGGKGGEK